MKYQTIYLLVRVQLRSDLANPVDAIRELEVESVVNMTDTANVDILETEVLLSRIHNPRVNRLKSDLTR